MSELIGHEDALLVTLWTEHHERGIVGFISFFVCVCVCEPWSSILSDMFNRVLAVLTEAVNVSYFIRNPKEEALH